MKEIIAVINQKGGVGKTTTAINLSYNLSALNYQTLLLDADPQQNAVSGLSGLPNATFSLETELNKTNPLKVLSYNYFVDPSCSDKVQIRSRFNEVLKANKLNNTDYIIIDCPPSISYNTVFALTVATGIIIPIQSEFFSMEGLTQMVSLINDAKNSYNEDLTLKGLLITMFDGSPLSYEIIEEIRKYHKDSMFDTIIHRNNLFVEASSFGLPILEFAPDTPGNFNYIDLIKEFLN